MAAAFDELRFGRENTLDLRASLPTGAHAVTRAEAFLRERQVASASEVLVITGRGNQSANGIPVVRPAVAALLARLRRAGVVDGWQEHTPGSYAVRPAPIRALFAAPRRHGDESEPVAVGSQVFDGLDVATRAMLRRLAIRTLESLGVPATEPFLQDEMTRQFSALGRAIPPGPHREAQLRAAAATALDEMDAAE